MNALWWYHGLYTPMLRAYGWRASAGFDPRNLWQFGLRFHRIRIAGGDVWMTTVGVGPFVAIVSGKWRNA